MSKMVYIDPKDANRLDRLLDGIQEMQKGDHFSQLENILGVYMQLQLPITPREVSSEVPWVAKRWKLFQLLPRQDQLVYIDRFISWRKTINFCASDVSLYLLPSISDFIVRIRTHRGYPDWMAWWACEKDRYDNARQHIQESAKERLLLDHLLEYESLGEPIPLRFQGNETALPSIHQLLHPSN
ncbi:hypothetical protein F4819DRAFT_489001 [Hypoxylon fuscum]|nr:hypothetical protein F4819DRAFT_489001 [Hypoxylon fuscum]